MSGLLRRIKRSRPADAGEPPVEGQAAAPEGDAAPQGEPAATPDAATPAAAETAAPRAWLTSGEPEPQAAAAPSAAEAPKPAPNPPEPPKPVLVANPDAPAGLELENQTTPRPPAGRRGRLRRRLRYLRRARELMLRDLGGLLYEVHRSGGGNVDAHATVLTAKVQRISGLDAEAHALETALASARPDAVIFEPGIGGTCPNCGELFSSASHFCANCGASVTDLPAPPAPTGQLTMDVEAATPVPVAEPFAPPDRRGFWKKAVGGRKRAAAVPEPGEGESAGAESPTQVLAPGADAAAGADAPAGADAATDGNAATSGDAPAGAVAPASTPALPVTAPRAPEGDAEAESAAATTTDGPTEGAETQPAATTDESSAAEAQPAATTDAPAATAEPAAAESASDERAGDTPAETAAQPTDPPPDATGGDDAPHRDDRSNGAGRAPDEIADADPLVTRRSHS